MIDHITPTWNIQDYHDLDYTLDYHKDKNTVEKYLAAGHDYHVMGIEYCFEHNTLPESALEVKQQFSQWYDHVTVAVNKFTPGRYLPMHVDLYGRYRSLFDPKGEREIIRFIVMLEHSQPGQIIQIGDQAHAHWQAGAVYHWLDEEPHAFYNLSLHTRYALQITGMVR